MLNVLPIAHVSAGADDCVLAELGDSSDVHEARKRAVRGESVGSKHDAIFVLEAEYGGTSDDGLRGVRRGI